MCFHEPFLLLALFYLKLREGSRLAHVGTHVCPFLCDLQEAQDDSAMINARLLRIPEGGRWTWPIPMS